MKLHSSCTPTHSLVTVLDTPVKSNAIKHRCHEFYFYCVFVTSREARECKLHWVK